MGIYPRWPKVNSHEDALHSPAIQTSEKPPEETEHMSMIPHETSEPTRFAASVRDTRRPRLALISFSDDFALGTRAMAAYVRKHGYICDLVFMKRHNARNYFLGPRNYDDLLTLLARLDPAVIGLSVSTNLLPFAEEASARIRAAFPQARLLWGGWHPTMNPERVLRAVDIDGVGVGECEDTILEILQRVEHGGTLDNCLGLWTKRDDAIVPIGQRPMIADLDSIPIFRFDEWTSHLIDDEGIHPFNMLPTGFGTDRYGYAVMTSRGCPYSCSFCSVPYMRNLYGKSGPTKYSIRRRSIESVIAELEYAKHTLGANFTWFFDEEFLHHRPWVRRFLPEYRDRIGLDFFCEFHPDGLRDAAMVDLLADAGLKHLEIGLQSASQRSLAIYNRPHRYQDLLVDLSKQFAKKDVTITYDVILDSKLDTEADVRATLDYLLRLERPFRVDMFPLAFRDNYPLTRNALEQGWITPKDLETEVLERDADANAQVVPAGRWSAMPLVQLSFLNCLIYLTQVDYLPKSWIRRWSRSAVLERHPAILAWTVIALHRLHLTHLHTALRRLQRRLVALIRDPGAAVTAWRSIAKHRSLAPGSTGVGASG
jgi:radical SAM superfamily enzyme YgiQ (UPF0313 family)